MELSRAECWPGLHRCRNRAQPEIFQIRNQKSSGLLRREDHHRRLLALPPLRERFCPFAIG